MLTSKEKAWFFLTGGYQPKINKLIFLVIFLVQSASTMMHEVCHESHARHDRACVLAVTVRPARS
ncbi:TPA: hypothetical protein MFN38_001112 [Klebsiella pneumoniae]|nr:hypothetical protein [Klebsiella pneumoniae]